MHVCMYVFYRRNGHMENATENEKSKKDSILN